MPLKHTGPQQSPQHSTETAESDYAVTNTRGISESSDLPADAITASSRVQSYLRDKRSLMNVVVVAHLQFFCCVLSLAFINGYGWIPFISALCSTTALYFRYRFPYGSIYVVIAALCLTLVAPFPDSLAVTCYPPVSLAAYHIGRHWTRRARFRGLILGWVGALAVTVQTLASFLYYWQGDLPARIFFSLMLGVLCGSIFTVFWFLGDSRRMRELRSEEFKERARRLEYEQEQERRLAAQDERTRIAREMHDIVAHSLSSIISQADGARYAAASARTARTQQAEQAEHTQQAEQSGQAQQQSTPDIAEQTLELIADTARDSLTQMRSLLGLLRTDEVTVYAPVPTLSDVPALVEQSRRAGLPVTFTGITGTMARTLPQGAELAAYRTVQEALTNALKHSPGAATTVTIHWCEDGLQLRVQNDPVSSVSSASPSAVNQRASSPVPGSGNGLRGMSERIALYHGILTYGLQPDGSWLVEATLPYRDL